MAAGEGGVIFFSGTATDKFLILQPTPVLRQATPRTDSD